MENPTVPSFRGKGWRRSNARSVVLPDTKATDSVRKTDFFHINQKGKQINSKSINKLAASLG